MSSDCVFCRIIEGAIPSDVVFESDSVLAFRDIEPVAPVHVLVVPKEHIVSAADLDKSNSYLVGVCFEAIAQIAKDEKLDEGFRVVTNSGTHGGQSVMHLHFHLIGGKRLSAGLA